MNMKYLPRLFFPLHIDYPAPSSPSPIQEGTIQELRVSPQVASFPISIVIDRWYRYAGFMQPNLEMIKKTCS